MSNSLIFGKDTTERVVAIETRDDYSHLFTEALDGTISEKLVPNRRFLLLPHNPSKYPGYSKLKGNLYYKYGRKFDTYREYNNHLTTLRRGEHYTAYDARDSLMLTEGVTYFKNCKLKEISVLSFDIETTTIEHNDHAKVILISNTYRRGDKIERKLFSYSDYSGQGELISAWCEWVRKINPSILIGHNIYMFDLPYLNFCAQTDNTTLDLGRDGSAIHFEQKPSKFRRDGSQFYEYTRSYVWGREIIDTFFLSIKYDVGRKYESYGLKYIIKTENLEVKDRVFYDASTIRLNYQDPVEFEKIKAYCVHDSDDSLALYDLMVPSYFYLAQSVPKSFSSLINTAPGSQINSFLVRSYIQEGHSLPKSSEQEEFVGAISIGNPGVYQNCFKVDVASLYPSIMLQYKVHDAVKDPNKNFLQMVEYFTEERLANKKRAKDTGDNYYKDLEQSQKIVINSAYGMLGAPGLLFNSPKNAAFVTRTGREILQQAIDWAATNDFKLVNADTDSITISDGNEISEQDQSDILDSINSMFPERIHFENDGYYKTVLVVKAKNYALWNGTKLKIKGSALKGTYKERALSEFMQKLIQSFISGEDHLKEIQILYREYIYEIFHLTDISRWASKKTITDSVLNPERTNEARVAEAVKDMNVALGDKVRVYFTRDGNLKSETVWANDHDTDRLCEKLFKTIKIFESVIDIKLFPNYKLKRNKPLLEILV